MVLCVVHIATTTRSLRIARETVSHARESDSYGNTDHLQHSEANYNFFNYCQSILVLMIWILPINIPVLVVWVRNLAVHWLTPFSSHHNILSIMPFILLVETLSTGRMVPRVTNRFVNILPLLVSGGIANFRPPGSVTSPTFSSLGLQATLPSMASPTPTYSTISPTSSARGLS